MSIETKTSLNIDIAFVRLISNNGKKFSFQLTFRKILAFVRKEIWVPNICMYQTPEF